MISLIWSFGERLLPRLASSVLLLFLAAVVDPANVGVYNWGTIVYTAYASVTDGAIRQVLVRASRDRNGLRFLRRYQFVVATAGVAVMSAAIAILYFSLPQDVSAQSLLLCPMIVAPSIVALNVRSLGKLQLAQKWKILATGQAVAAIASLVIVLPLLLAFESLIACAFGLLLTEIVFTYWCYRNAKALTAMSLQADGVNHLSDYVHMAVYSVLGWMQGQMDRVLIGFLSGPATLGIFTLASALARSLGDALAASNANILRSELAAGGSRRMQRRTADRVLRRGLMVAGFAIVVTLLAVEYIVRPFLGESWASALEIVPVLSLVAIPSMLSWSCAVLHVANDTSRRAFLAPAIGIAFALPTAWLAAIDLNLAAWIVLAREIALCSIAFLSMGRSAPWASFCLAMVMCALFAIGMIFVQVL